MGNVGFYRLTRTSEGDRSLRAGDSAPVSGPAEVGTSKPKEDDTSPLSEIIKRVNERFGTDWKPEDRLLLEQVTEDLARDEELTTRPRRAGCLE